MSSNSSSNPLSVVQLFNQLEKDIYNHLHSADGLAQVTLRINSYSRLIKAHPDNTHTNSAIPDTLELLDRIQSNTKMYGTFNGSSSNSLAVKAYTRIIAGRK